MNRSSQAGRMMEGGERWNHTLVHRSFQALVYETRVNFQRAANYLSLSSLRRGVQAHRRPTGTILLVHERREVAEMIRMVLTVSGYSVLWAEHADQGWALLEQHAVDVVVHNIQLGAGQTEAFDRRIRERWEKQKLGIIICSSFYVPPEYMENYGINAYLSAPFDPQELPALVEEILGQSEKAGRPRPSEA